MSNKAPLSLSRVLKGANANAAAEPSANMFAQYCCNSKGTTKQHVASAQHLSGAAAAGMEYAPVPNIDLTADQQLAMAQFEQQQQQQQPYYAAPVHPGHHQQGDQTWHAARRTAPGTSAVNGHGVTVQQLLQPAGIGQAPAPQPAMPGAMYQGGLEDELDDADTAGLVLPGRQRGPRHMSHVLNSPDDQHVPLMNVMPIPAMQAPAIDLTSPLGPQGFGMPIIDLTNSDMGVQGTVIHNNSSNSLASMAYGGAGGSSRPFGISASPSPTPYLHQGLYPGMLGGMPGQQLGALPRSSSARLEGLGGGGSRGLMLTSAVGGLRTVKLQAPEQRQQEAQLRLQQQQKGARSTRLLDDSDEDEEQAGDGGRALLARVEQISDTLRELLEAQQAATDRLIGDGAESAAMPSTGQAAANQKRVLVTREEVSAACNAEVAGTLKGYQLVGINFLMLLSRSGICGGAILADEMGLGKTAQTITFLGVLQHQALQAWREGPASRMARGPRPHLIICPASLLENWQRELKRWCPKQRVVTYYGKDKKWLNNVLTTWHMRADVAAKKRAAGLSPPAPLRADGAGAEQLQGSILQPAVTGEGQEEDVMLVKSDDSDEEDAGDEGSSEEGDAEMEGDPATLGFELSDPESGEAAPFDVLLTTYSIYERESNEAKHDRSFVSKWRWSHLVADEAHALKNRNSVRVQKLMKVASSCQHRILLTGTPLQNDVGELLNLLRFLMPSLFGSEDEDMSPEALLGPEAKDPKAQAEVAERVRRIMTPFILRRLKSEVANQLVAKTHELIEVDMFPEQADLYKAAIQKLKAEAAAAARGKAGRRSSATPAASEVSDAPASKRRRTRGAAQQQDSTISELSDASGGMGTKAHAQKAGSNVEDGSRKVGRGKKGLATVAEETRDGSGSKVVQQEVVIANPDGVVAKLGAQKVNNLFTHLRKIALHPLLVRHKYNDARLLEMAQIATRKRLFGGQCTLDRVLAEMGSWSDHTLHDFASNNKAVLSDFVLPADTVYNSGKLQLLRTLLLELKAKGSRVLLFSQWTQMLDIMEWFMHKEGYAYVRLDGSTQVDERLAIVDKFNDPAGNIFVFLLSTRAGGQGLNLTGADTVILHDVDFNPQVDRQAEDRCHRLGQTKPVKVYRLVTRGSVDRNIYDIAHRKLELDAAIMQGVAAAAQDQEDGSDGVDSSATDSTAGQGKKRGRPPAAGKAAGKAGGGETRHMGAILAALLRDQ